MTSHLETACRALWLVDIGLLDARARSLETVPDRLWLRMEWLGLRDEASAREVAGRLFAKTPRLMYILDRLCKDLFLIRRGHAVLKADHSIPQGRRLIRVVDPDTLICLHPGLTLAPQDRRDWPVVPMDDGGLITGLAARGSVETHIHLGGALPPCFYWLLFAGGALAPEAVGKMVSSRGDAEQLAWVAAVRRATWLRFALAREAEEAALRRGEERVFPHLPPIKDQEWDLFGEEEEERLGELKTWRLREALYGLTRPVRGGEMGKKWLLYDPLREPPVEGTRIHHACGERRLLTQLRRCLDEESTASSDETPLARRLLEYLRVRNAFHGLLVHDEGSEGLHRFSESLRRRGLGQREPQRKGLRKRRFQRALLRMEEVRMEAALETQLVEPFDWEEGRNEEAPWRRIEMRVSVPSGPQSLRWFRAWIDGIATHVLSGGEASDHRSQVGLVFHLHKDKSGEAAAEVARKEARRLFHFLSEHPGLRPLVVGFDVAGRERAAPPRTFLLAYRELQREVSQHRPQPHHAPMRIGYTYHVGEDCTDLLTGLRHLDEVVCLLLPEEEGGRLGHALALAEKPVRFYRRRGMQTEPRMGTHLLDLVWAWGRLLATEQAHLCPGLLRKILHLVGSAPMDAAPLFRCWEAMRLDVPNGEEQSVEERAAEEESSEEALLKILGFQGQPERAQVRADEAWLAMVAGLQKLLQERLRGRRLCIEANPTSNLIVGGYTSYAEIPCLALVESGFSVSINTDDPGMFMTSLPGEAAAMYGALREKQESHRNALAWLADRWFDADTSTFLRTPRRWTREAVHTMLRYEPE